MVWKEPTKCINRDIEFLPHREIRNALMFADVEIISQTVEGLYVNGHYNCNLGSLSFNFSIKGIGSIARYCLNNATHADVGRYHFHRVKKDGDVRKQLPFAERRDDLRGLSPSQVWPKLCVVANIVHIGHFFDPEVMCK